MKVTRQVGNKSKVRTRPIRPDTHDVPRIVKFYRHPLGVWVSPVGFEIIPVLNRSRGKSRWGWRKDWILVGKRTVIDTFPALEDAKFAAGLVEYDLT